MESDNLAATSPVQPEPDSKPLQDTVPTFVEPPLPASPASAAGEITPASLPDEIAPEPSPSLEQDETPSQDLFMGAQVAPIALNKRKGGLSWVLWALLGFLALMLIAGWSAYGGYRSAVQDRMNFQSTQVAGESQAQFDLVLQDIEAKNYELARQRLEYIIQMNPGFPGAAEKLAEVLLEQRITATPTTAPTPTLTPTPDFRTRDELYSQAQGYLASSEWSTAIDTLLTLRKKYPDFMAIKVDGMLYVALRNRGIDKIALEADLEGGTYDLTLAERFGPLDAEAKNWRDWAELYTRGASFWDVDWSQAVFYFSQLAPSAPNLRDGSGWTATDRFMKALLGYGDWLAAHGQWCDAQAQYDTYMSLLADPQVEPTAVHASDKCSSGDTEPEELTETPTPGSAPAGTTATPTPTQPQATPTPTETPPDPTATSGTAYP